MTISYITCDSEHGVAYIALGDLPREKRHGLVVSCQNPAPGVELDYDKDGNLVGIEVY